MKKILSILLSLSLTAIATAQGLDSLAKAQLGTKIDEYFSALAGMTPEAQCTEADFMIDLTRDPDIRQFTAQRIYEHYRNSPVMGAENVAVHIFDVWFDSGPLKMSDETEFLNARIFAEFNRLSLIGKQAPEISMETSDGSYITLFTTDDSTFVQDDSQARYRVLYFYDTDCAKCQLESILLRNILITEAFPIEFYAIYSGDNREAWTQYIKERFDIGDVAAKITHLWDPAIDSDFQRKYGVIQTPRLFLIDPSGKIIGRGLDAKALLTMLDKIFKTPEMTYGGEESQALFDNIFAAGATFEEVKGIADYIETSTYDNELMFKQLTGDMLYWLSNRSGEAFKEGMGYLIEDKILSRPRIWRTADDSLKVIGLAKFNAELLAKAKPGTVIAGLKLPAERIKGSKSRYGKFRLDKLKGQRNIIIFYTEGCNNCKSSREAALELAAKDRGVLVLMVDVDDILATYPDLGTTLFETFDLSTLPLVLETDRKGKILRRYISMQ